MSVAIVVPWRSEPGLQRLLQTSAAELASACLSGGQDLPFRAGGWMSSKETSSWKQQLRLAGRSSGPRTGSEPCPGLRPRSPRQRNLGANSPLSVYSGVSSLDLPRKQLCEERENAWSRGGAQGSPAEACTAAAPSAPRRSAGPCLCPVHLPLPRARDLAPGPSEGLGSGPWHPRGGGSLPQSRKWVPTGGFADASEQTVNCFAQLFLIGWERDF